METTTQTESPTYSTAQAVDDISALRDKIAAMTPNIIPELLTGNSIAELTASLESSRAIFERYMGTPAAPAAVEVTQVTATKDPEPAPPAVPSGGASFTDDIDKLPATELIRRGLAFRKQQ